MTRSDHGFWRQITLDIFPWLAGIFLDDRKDLSIRSASGRVHLASTDGTEDPAVVCVGHLGDGGKLTIAGNVITYTGPDGTTWTITIAGSVTLTLAPGVNPSKVGQIVTKATQGSERVTAAS